MRRLESTNSGDNFNEQEKYCDQIKSWLKSQKQRFDIEELKNESGFTGAESFYIRLSEVARAAFPAVGGISSFGTWLKFNFQEKLNQERGWCSIAMSCRRLKAATFSSTTCAGIKQAELTTWLLLALLDFLKSIPIISNWALPVY